MMQKLWMVLICGYLASVHLVEAQQANQTRLAEVAKRGQKVMPFDLDKTRHRFSKNNRGGIQQVFVLRDDDYEQIGLIRRHLKKITDDFQQGRFADPIKIHGHSMPGIKELQQAKPADLAIKYQYIKGGGQISYVSSHPPLIKAIHRWFDAQVSDHGRHAGHHQ